MTRRLLTLASILVLGWIALPAIGRASEHTGDCWICDAVGGFNLGARCQPAFNDGDGIVCHDYYITDSWGTRDWSCSIDLNPCNRIEAPGGGGSAGGGDSGCSRDPVTGVCPASCFSCGGGDGGRPAV